MLFSRMAPLVKSGLFAAALAAGSLASSAPAAAHGWHRGGNDAAIAIGAGVVGLAIGAAVASNSNDIGYYPGDFPVPGYYPPYPAYRGGFYGPGHPGWNAYPAYPVWRGYDWRFEQERRWRAQRRWERRRGWRGW